MQANREDVWWVAGGALNPPITRANWDWNGIIGTGQSLGVGELPILSTRQLHNNLMLDLGGATVPPWDPEQSTLAMVPLVERRNARDFPAPYPSNLWGETPHSAMAAQITELVRTAIGADFTSVHSIVGESGQGIDTIKRQAGTTYAQTGRAFAAALFEAAAIQRLATAAGRTYGIGAIVLTNGETDWNNPNYMAEVVQLRADLEAALRNITGQATKIPLLISQQFAFPSGPNQRPVSTQAQWRLGEKFPAEFTCTGPKYQYDGLGDAVHLSSQGYQQLGEKIGQVYYERIVLGRDWQPLQPVAVERNGERITVRFHVPVPPLRWDESLGTPSHAWPKGKGFELSRREQPVAIESVEIVGDAVIITCEHAAPEEALTLAYAMAPSDHKMSVASRGLRWGQLCDSDPCVGTTTLLRQSNYAVSFEWLLA